MDSVPSSFTSACSSFCSLPFLPNEYAFTVPSANAVPSDIASLDAIPPDTVDEYIAFP